MDLFFRPAKTNELPRILEIYALARKYMKENGNPDQWGETYPMKESIIDDINKGISMVLVDERKHIYGVFALCSGNDPTYQEIENGAWLSSLPYYTIHRIASSFERKGFAQEAFSFVASKGLNIRADTHKDNIIMQKALLRFGFRYCGIIHIERGEERLAYEYLN